MHLAVLIAVYRKYLPRARQSTGFIWRQFIAMWHHTNSNIQNTVYSGLSFVCIYICVCFTSVYVCTYLHRSVYVIQEVKDRKILCWLYSVMLLSWVSVRGVWLDSLVLDNCTLPRSVVPFSVSLWPRLQEPYLGCTSSSSYPVSSPSCPTHPHNAVGGR